MNRLHPKMHCAKFGWNWPSSSGEKDFKISSMYFCYFVSISPWKIGGPSFEQAWIPVNQGCIVPSLVEIDPMVFKISSIYFRHFKIPSLGKDPAHDHKLRTVLSLKLDFEYLRFYWTHWFNNLQVCTKYTLTQIFKISVH